MKILALILFVLLFSIITANSQSPCLPQGITFTSQAQIDNFQTNYPGCTEIEGDVVIGQWGSNISSLEGLDVLISIGGGLLIEYNNALTSLNGLENLASIGGNLRIYYNEALASLTALQNLTSVVGVDISYNDVLPGLTGLEGLTYIGGDLTIQGNDALGSLRGLDNLMSVENGLLIYFNTTLTSLTNLQGLTSMDYLHVTCNYSLISLSGLENVTSLVNELIICGNDDLTSLSGLDGLTSTGGVLISDNFLLTSLSGLENLTSIGDDLWITDNSLTSLSGLNGLTSIGRNLHIEGNHALSSLVGLESLTSVDSTLEILYNGSLPSLTGLESITSIGGNFIIQGNNSLCSLNGLEGLTSIGGALKVLNAGSLTNLTGLSNLTSIGNGLSITGNNSLSTCEARWLCDYISNPSGSIEINDNATGCSSVIELANACDGIPCLPYGIYYFSGQTDIDNFHTAFPDCIELAGNVTINGGDITNLNGLNEITSIGGSLFIYGNMMLTSLAGLDGLNSVEGSLSIGKRYFGQGGIGNPSLSSLTGLNSLTSVGSLTVYDNDSLISLAGLDNIEASSINWLLITNNYSLSHCAVQSICDYLASPNGSVYIYFNAAGCNTKEEVQESCYTTIIEEIDTVNGITIIPNPSHTTITIASSAMTNNILLSIFNVSGEKVMERQLTNNETQLDISALPRGMYFVWVQDEKMVEVEKIIIQ